MNTLSKWILTSLGLIALATGVVGIVLPILPSTPFFILAAFLFSKSSPHFNQWLRNHPRLGPLIHDWEEHRAIRKGPKVLATLVISSSLAYLTLVSHKPLWLKLTVSAILSGALLFIWTRPHGPHQKAA